MHIFTSTKQTNTMRNKKIDATKLETLTIENARSAKYIINKDNPEWGEKRFNFDESGRRHHTWGVGPNSALLFEQEFKFWAVVSYK